MEFPSQRCNAAGFARGGQRRTLQRSENSVALPPINLRTTTSSLRMVRDQGLVRQGTSRLISKSIINAGAFLLVLLQGIPVRLLSNTAS